MELLRRPDTPGLGVSYFSPIPYNTRFREHEVKLLERKAAKLGFTVTPKTV